MRLEIKGTGSPALVDHYSHWTSSHETTAATKTICNASHIVTYHERLVEPLGCGVENHAMYVGEQMEPIGCESRKEFVRVLYSCLSVIVYLPRYARRSLLFFWLDAS